MSEVDRSGILAWTDENIETAPETCGVYVLRPKDRSVVGYIGMAGAGRLRARLKEHKSSNDHPRTAYFDWYQHDSEQNARDTESAWIAEHDPPWN